MSDPWESTQRKVSTALLLDTQTLLVHSGELSPKVKFLAKKSFAGKQEVLSSPLGPSERGKVTLQPKYRMSDVLAVLIAEVKIQYMLSS